MANLEQVTYCGLYCGLCAQRNRIPQRAASLRDALRKEGYENWGKELPHFVEFWSFLNNLADSEARCSCRSGKCGPPDCSIRKCAQKKGVDTCPSCTVYPCDKIMAVAKGYPTLLSDAQRMKEKGVDVWIKEQETRAKTGFAYVDIRIQPYLVPQD